MLGNTVPDGIVLSRGVEECPRQRELMRISQGLRCYKAPKSQCASILAPKLSATQSLLPAKQPSSL